MSNRTIRRAAERQAAKAAARLQKLQQQSQPTAHAVAAEPQVQPHAMAAAAGSSTEVSTRDASKRDISTRELPTREVPAPAFTEATTTDPTPTSTRQISEAQLNANRANSQKSTGPVTLEGKAKSSLNAIKTGLTGATVLLPTDDAIAYQSHLDRHFKQESPATDQEHTLVQMIADAEWRILRIPSLETSIYAIGRRKLADLHADEQDPAVRDSLITGEILLTYRRDLSNLALQERRLRNQMKSDQEKLKALREERLENKSEKARIQDRMTDAIKAKYNAMKTWGHFNPAEFGFDFSFDEIEHCQDARRNGIPPSCTADMLAHFRNCEKKENLAA